MNNVSKLILNSFNYTEYDLYNKLAEEDFSSGLAVSITLLHHGLFETGRRPLAKSSRWSNIEAALSQISNQPTVFHSKMCSLPFVTAARWEKKSSNNITEHCWCISLFSLMCLYCNITAVAIETRKEGVTPAVRNRSQVYEWDLIK